jgi:hypothetical protein
MVGGASVVWSAVLFLWAGMRYLAIAPCVVADVSCLLFVEE